jgi:hypothetical protein
VKAAEQRQASEERELAAKVAAVKEDMGKKNEPKSKARH